MQNLLAFAIVGFGAQLVDGALGMAFGVTASTLLLVNGLTPALASASVHLAELGTSLAPVPRTGVSATSTGGWWGAWACPAPSAPS